MKREHWIATAVIGVCILWFGAPASALPPGWSKEVIAPSAHIENPREVRATILDGKPTVFFYDWVGNNHVQQAQRASDGTWSITPIVTGAASAVPFWMDYAVIGGTPWLAVSGSGQVQLFAREGGTWTSQYVHGGGGYQYGDRIALADNGGQPVVVYAGQDPTLYSRYVKILDNAGGEWTETNLSTLGYSITGLDVEGITGVVGVTVSYERSGTYYNERSGGVWSSALASGETLGDAVLAGSNGLPSFFTAARGSGVPVGPSRVYTRGNDWQSMIVAPLSFPVGQDYKILDGVPTVAYYERGQVTNSDNMLHLAVFDGAAWNDTVLDVGSDNYERDVSLLSFNGHPAVATYDNSTYQMDFYYQIPEPATLSLLILGGLAMLRRRQ